MSKTQIVYIPDPTEIEEIDKWCQFDLTKKDLIVFTPEEFEDFKHRVADKARAILEYDYNYCGNTGSEYPGDAVAKVDKASIYNTFYELEL